MLDRFFRYGWVSLAAVAIVAAPANAQSPGQQDAFGAIGGLLGALAQAGAKSRAERGWAQASEPLRSCVSLAFSAKNVSIEQLVAAGIAPSDKRLAPIMTFCNQLMSTELKTNFPCNVPNSRGLQVSSLCDQKFAKDEGGLVSEITRDEFIQRVGNGEKIQIAVIETAAAKQARLYEEQKAVEAERQRYLNSPEGRRAAAQKRIEAANIARRWPFVAEFHCRSRRDGTEVDIASCLQYGGRYTNIVINNGESLKRYGTREGNYGYLDSSKYTINLGSQYSINAESSNFNFYIFVEIKDRSGNIVRNMVFR